MRRINQSEDIFNFIKGNPGATIQSIADGTGWNQHIVEIVTRRLASAVLIDRVVLGRRNDPMAEVIFVLHFD